MKAERSAVQSILAAGAVRTWHVVFLIVMSWAVSIVAGAKLTERMDSAFRPQMRELVTETILSLIIVAFVAVVPELRRTLSQLLTRPSPLPTTSELAGTYALLLTWGYGVYLASFCFPVLAHYPSAYQLLYFGSAIPPLEPKHAVLVVCTVILAPIAEELLFRGYLLNLLIIRMNIWPALVLSSLLFGVLHMERTVFAAPLGFALALVYLKYRSLWPGIALHAAYNFACVPWLLGGIFYLKPLDSVQDWRSWTREFVLTALFIPIAVWFWRRFKPARPAS